MVGWVVGQLGELGGLVIGCSQEGCLSSAVQPNGDRNALGITHGMCSFIASDPKQAPMHACAHFGQTPKRAHAVANTTTHVLHPPQVAPNIPAEVLYDRHDDGLKLSNSWAEHYSE